MFDDGRGGEISTIRKGESIVGCEVLVPPYTAFAIVFGEVAGVRMYA